VLWSAAPGFFLLTGATCVGVLCCQAPGYSGIIKNPMDLSVMKTKVEGGMYGSWNEIMVSPETHMRPADVGGIC
jgi:hypothetical protein